MSPADDITFSRQVIQEQNNKFQDFKNTQKKASYSKKKKTYNRPKNKFDPNIYEKSEWMQLGLSEKQALSVLTFSKNGIYSQEQVQKIFVIPEELYVLIKDSLIFPVKESKVNNYPTKTEKTIISVNVNNATLEELQKVKGIGPFYSKQIIKYRDQLGGFNSKSQLMEVWKMDQEKYDGFEEYITIDNKLTKLNINTVKVEELKNHPYINWNLANAIIKYRDQHGDFKNLEELKEIKILDAETFIKIKPYLTLLP